MVLGVVLGCGGNDDEAGVATLGSTYAGGGTTVFAVVELCGVTAGFVVGTRCGSTVRITDCSCGDCILVVGCEYANWGCALRLA